MSKYSPLGEFLKDQSAAQVPMTFKEIERLTGHKLPASALQHRAWWSNNPRNSVITNAWLKAGFRSEQVDMARRKLVFRRMKGAGPKAMPASAGGGDMAGEKPFHPLFGIMKGLTRVPPGVDLTEPADPDWGKVYD